MQGSREKDFTVAIAEWVERQPPELLERNIKIPELPNHIVAIIGPRQAGKTYRCFQQIKQLLKQYPKNNILYVNFEHERLRNLDATDLEEMMKVFHKLMAPSHEYPIFLFLDEIQNVRDWDKWVRRTFDSNKYKIYITGSSSKLSSREIATTLRGRSIDYTVFPFSFREFLKAKNFPLDNLEILSYLERRGEILRMLEEYLEFGGYPKVTLTQDNEEKRRLLRTYYETIFYKDLMERYRIRDPALLDEFLRYSISTFSKYLSISKAYNYLKSIGLKCSKSTLIKFLRYANEIYFLFPVEIFSYSIKDRRQYPKKIYVVSNGIITSLFPETLDNKGRLMENTVAIELVRRGKQSFYWREYGKREGMEVDFVIRKGLRIEKLLQVTYATSLNEVKDREIEGLIKAGKALKCNNLQIITWDYEGEEMMHGKRISFVPLWKWLLLEK